MQTSFSPADLSVFQAYVKVQKSAKYNMFDPRAAQAAGLTRDQMVFVMSNYDKLSAANIPKHPVLNIHHVQYFATREEARQYCAEIGVPQSMINKNNFSLHISTPKGKRWFV